MTKMTPAEELHYAEGILVRNVFSRNDIDYYMGKSKRRPHGIDNAVWKKAAHNVGFNHRNLQEVGGKFMLKKLNARAKRYSK